MTPTPNAIDLSTLLAVKQWANAGIVLNSSADIPASSPYVINPNAQYDLAVSYANGKALASVATAPSAGQYVFLDGEYYFAAADAGQAILLNYVNPTTDDQQIQDCITAFSDYVLYLTSRGPQNGSFPTESPFVQPVQYDEVYDGSGTPRQQVNNWPVTAVASVNINGLAVPQSTNVNTPGWVVDGDGKFISLRGGMNQTVATFQNYRSQGVGSSFMYGGGFSPGIQNVEIVYTAGFNGVPPDLEMATRKTVALNYVRRGWIGQKSRALAQGAGTVTYGTWEMDDDCKTIIYKYRRMTG